MSRFSTGVSCTALLALAALSVVPAQAQETETSQGDQVRRYEPITVTARRQEESLFNVPGQVSAFSAETLVDDFAAENIGVLQGTVPNLNIVQGRGSQSAANIYIRGIGQPDALASFDPAVGVYVDDVYISRIRGALFDVYAVERIEVLRGPQGTLYGKNTNGGAIKIVTQKPGDEFEADFRLGLGNYDAFEFSATMMGPLTDKIGAGVTLYDGSRDGYVKDPNGNFEYNNKDTWAVRGTVVFDPTDNLNIVFNADYTEESPNMTVGQPQSLLYAVDLAPPTPAQTIVPLFVPSGEEFDFETTTSLTRAGGTPMMNSNELEHLGFGLTAEWEINDAWTLKSITAKRDLEYIDYIDIDATELELGDVLVAVDQDQTSQEFQLLYDGGGRFRSVSGLFWLNENVSSHQEAYADDYLLLGGFPLAFIRLIDDSLNLHSYAFFTNVVFDVNDKLSITGGLRYTYELKTYQRLTTTTFDPVGFGFNVSDSWEDLSPLISLDYQFDETTFGYAKIAKGFKSGGFNGRANAAGDETPYDPEVVWSYEAGLRKTLNDGRVNLSGAIFYNDYQDFQARVSVARGPGEFDFPVFNAGQLDIFGAEFEVLAYVTDNFTVDAQIGYLDASYGEFLDQNAPTGDRADTDEPAFAPDWTARFGAAYEFDLNGSGVITVGGDASYRGEMALAVDQQVPEVFQEGYWLGNARIVWTSENEDWSFGLYGKNLTDEVYKTDFQEFSSVGGIRTAYFGAPRTWMFQITKSIN